MQERGERKDCYVDKEEMEGMPVKGDGAAREYDPVVAPHKIIRKTGQHSLDRSDRFVLRQRSLVFQHIAAHIF